MEKNNQIHINESENIRTVHSGCSCLVVVGDCFLQRSIKFNWIRFDCLNVRVRNGGMVEGSKEVSDNYENVSVIIPQSFYSSNRLESLNR